MRNKIEVRVKRDNWGAFEGYVEVWVDGRRRYNIDSFIIREDLVDAQRDAERLKADLRRFLPLYLKRLQNVKDRIAYDDAYQNKKTANIRALIGDRLLSEYEARTGKISLNFAGYGHVAVSSDSASFELSSVDLETAKKIIALLPERKDEEVA